MLNRRDFLRLSGMATTGALLSGCGAVAPAAPQPAAGSGAASAGASSGLSYQGEVEMWDWDYTIRNDYVSARMREFEEMHPGVTFNYTPLGWTDMETKILTAAAAGSGPAYANIHYFWRYDLQRAGVLAAYPDDLFNYDELVSTPYTRDPETGKIYTFTACYYTDQVYFNQELLDAEGIQAADIPRNWDDFMRMAQQLTKTDANGKITQVGCSMNDYWAREWLWHSLVYQQGGWVYNESGTEALWNSEEGIRALQLIKDFYHNYKVDDSSFLEQGDGFGNGKIAMYINQGYTAPGINSSFPQMEGNWSTEVVPTFTGRPDPSWGLAIPEEGFGVFNNHPVEVQEVGFAFIKHTIGTDERRLDWAFIDGGPPDKVDLLDHPRIKEEDVGRVIETQALTLPWRVNYGERPLEAEKFWRTMFDEVILGNADPKVALDSATEQMNVALRESNEKRYIVERNYKPPAS
jgi:ABC-type glycerol-3-phosphate transport system substrate-binding protein